jgi:hypothetical protein
MTENERLTLPPILRMTAIISRPGTTGQPFLEAIEQSIDD